MGGYRSRARFSGPQRRARNFQLLGSPSSLLPEAAKRKWYGEVSSKSCCYVQVEGARKRVCGEGSKRGYVTKQMDSDSEKSNTARERPKAKGREGKAATGRD
jgi:hypothetical protein